MEVTDTKTKLLKGLLVSFILFTVIDSVIFFALFKSIFHDGWFALLTTPLLLLCSFIGIITLAIISFLLWAVQRPETRVEESEPGHYYFDL